MPKPNLAQLLTSSGYTTYTPELISRASASLYGNVGAGLDSRDWDAIMAADNPLQASEDALITIYQGSPCLVDNANHLQDKGYSGNMIEWTVRQMQMRLGIDTYDPGWADGTWMEVYAQKSDTEVYNDAKADVPNPSAPPPVTITTNAAPFDTTAGTGMISGETADTGTDNTIEIAAAAHLNGSSVVDGLGGTNTVSLTETGVIYNLDQGDAFSNVSKLTIADGVTNVTMSVDQHKNVFTTKTADGSGDQITFSTAGTVTGDGAIETYSLANGSGNDFTGDSVAQTINGGTGSDIISTGGGADTINANGGDDTVTISTAAGNTNTIDGGAHTNGDTLKLVDAAVNTSKFNNVVDLSDSSNNQLQGSTDLTGLTNFENVDASGLTGGNEVTLVGSGTANTLKGGTGGDQITGGGGADIMSAGSDSVNDVFIINAGDSNTGSEDKIQYFDITKDTIILTGDNGADGIDVTALTEAGNVTGYGEYTDMGSEDVQISSDDGNTKVTSSDLSANIQLGTSTTAFTSNGAAIVGGDLGNDIVGGSSAQTITGGSGVDSITGGDGVDTINVGAVDTEIDTVNLTTGGNNLAIVQNFEAGGTGDKLQVADVTFAIANGTLDGAFDLLKNSNDQDFNTTDSTTANKTVFVFTNANREITGTDSGSDDLTFANLAAGTVTVTDMEGAAAVELNAGGGSSNLATGENVFIALDDGTSTGIFYAVGDGANLAAEDLQLVGVIDSLADCGDLWEQNFSIV